jgi:methyl-accepting chemotaxis protein/methyl-accepting chemotaxis protein-1 (serine sensor receptor)
MCGGFKKKSDSFMTRRYGEESGHSRWRKKVRKRLTVGQKLSLSFGVVLGLTALLTYSSVDTAQRLGGLLDTEVNENANIADLIAAIKLDLRDMKDFSISAQFSYSMGKILAVNSSESHNARNIGECSVCHAFGSVEENRQGFAKLAQQASANADQLLPLVHDKEGREVLATIRGSIQDWESMFQRYLELISTGDFAGGHGLVQGSMVPLMQKMDAAANLLQGEQRKLRASSKAAAADSVSRSDWTTAVLLGISLICGGVLVVVIRRINNVLREFSGKLKEGAARVSDEAVHLHEAAEGLGQCASDQATSLEETASSSQRVVATAHQNAERSAQASRLVQNVRSEMNETSVVLDHTMRAMGEMSESSERISKIIKVIDEIAFQTNLLALNAAVEAARSGEAGMGFAVVAGEVRGLAQRCTTAAHDTSNLIEESIERSRQGKARLDELTSHIRSIAQGTEAVSALAKQVQDGSLEQERAMQEIEGALVRMQSSTEKSAVNAQHNADTGGRLGSESTALRNVVEGLDALVGHAR